MTNSNVPPNGGSTEYGNLMGRLGGIRELLDDEFAKKLENGDLTAFTNPVAAASTVAIGMISSGTLPGFQPTPIQQLINQLGGVVDDVATQGTNIVRGGIGGLVKLGQTLLGVLLKIISVTFAILLAIFFIETEIQRISAIINEVLSLKDRVIALEEEVTGLREVINTGFDQQTANLTTLNANLESVQGNIARGIRATATSTNNLIKQQTTELKESIEGINEGVLEKIEEFRTEQNAEWDLNKVWQNDNRAAAVATLTVAGVTAPDGMLDKTAKGVETVKQTVSNVATSVQQGFDNMQQKFKKIGAMIDVGRIIDVITLITVIHNAAMLSRGLFETLFQVVDNGLNAALNAFGVKDIDDEGVNSRQAFAQTVDQIGRSIFGVSTWNDLKAKWAAANRIVSTGTTLLWSVRDLMDNTQNLAEIAAENSAKVNNALRRAGQIFDTGPWMSENYNYRTLMHRRITNLNEFLGNAQNLAQVFEELTSTTIEIQENINEINENNEKFTKALKDGEKVIRVDNNPVKSEEDAAKTKSNSVTSVTSSDLEESSN